MRRAGERGEPSHGGLCGSQVTQCVVCPDVHGDFFKLLRVYRLPSLLELLGALLNPLGGGKGWMCHGPNILYEHPVFK